MRRARHANRAASAVTVGVTAGAALLVAALAQGPAEMTLFVPLAVCLLGVGALLGLRNPRNPIGWLVLTWGVDVSFCCFVTTWGARTVRDHGTAGGLQRWLSVLVPVLWHPGFVLFIVALLLFPHGRLVSRRWRVAVVYAALLTLTLAVSAGLSPRASMGDYVPGVRPPFVSALERAATDVFGVTLSLMLPTLLMAATSVFLRWRRSSGDDRRQVTAFALPTATALTLFVLSILIIGDGRLGVVLLAVLPISLAVAVTRYRLYELDRIISRTVTYGVVSAAVVGVYVGAVQLVNLALPTSGPIAVAAATLAAAAVFTPLRRRVQHAVDRRFNRAHYDGERVVDQLRGRLRRDVDLPQVQADLLGSVHAAVQPSSVSVWLRSA